MEKIKIPTIEELWQEKKCYCPNPDVKEGHHECSLCHGIAEPKQIKSKKKLNNNVKVN